MFFFFYLKNCRFSRGGAYSPFFDTLFFLGLTFSRGHRLLRVPHDPYLAYVFDGEEIGMGARCWTHGYDM